MLKGSTRKIIVGNLSLNNRRAVKSQLRRGVQNARNNPGNDLIALPMDDEIDEQRVNVTSPWTDVESLEYSDTVNYFDENSSFNENTSSKRTTHNSSSSALQSFGSFNKRKSLYEESNELMILESEGEESSNEFYYDYKQQRMIKRRGSYRKT